MGERRPRLSWIVESSERAQVQAAYRVLVSSSPTTLAEDRADLWDSGKITSDATSQVAYAGTPLSAREACYWKVQVWDREGRVSAWSRPARWEMGLLEPGDWTAKWLDATPSPMPVKLQLATYGTKDPTKAKDVTEVIRAALAKGEPIVASNEALGGDPAPDTPKRLEIRYECDGAVLTRSATEHSRVEFTREPYLRRRFTLSKPVAAARVFATALGFYELSLNGERVGDHHFDPGWTDYRTRVRYQAYDVTHMLKQGDNTIGAIVGPGWFCGRAGLFHISRFYGDSPALLAQLEITYTDGTTGRICTDDAWERHDGPTLDADLLDGETCDARLALPNWCAAASGDSGWSKARTREEHRNLVASVDAPVRALMELPARSVSEPKPGRLTFDMGQNMVGVVRLALSAPAGTVLTLRYGELLNPDGTIYTANLRGAAATDTYICRGGGPETWTPHFTFHGFRYVELSGLASAPGLSAVTGVVLGSDLPAAGTFECSDQSLNQLQSNIQWGQRGNYLSIPTDCPQRDERMGWMADTQVFVPTAAYNADIAPFMTKWLTDVDDAQRADGAYSDVSPVTKGLNYGTPAWADAGTIVPWALYETYGDTRILERHIDAMTRWVDWCREHSTGFIRDHDRGNDYGDWLSIHADTPKDLIGTAYFARSAWIVANSLRVLGRPAEAAKYDALFTQIRAAFDAKFVDATGRISGDTQSGYVLALRFELLPKSLRAAAANRLVADIQSKGFHLSTGFVGVSMLLPVLEDAGHPDMAYRMLLQDTFPSWLYSVRQGATTIWERWDGATERGPHPDESMNSFNHYALGSCGQWLYEGVGGIRADQPGFSHAILRPQVDAPLTWARTTHRSIRGAFATDWKREGDQLTLSITIPANSAATAYIPVRAGDEVLEGGKPLEQALGVLKTHREPTELTLELGSGTYTFTSRMPVMHAGNPVLPGWYADPEAAFFRSEYWLYPTASAPYDQQTAFDAFSSPDLVHWTKHPKVLDARSVKWARRAMWAPSVVENHGRYYFFFAANDIQNDGESGGIGVAVSDNPAGPFQDLTGTPLVGKFEHGAQPIDPFVFHDSKTGQWYLIYGGWRHCNIARLRDDFAALQPLEDGTMFREITPEGYVEGPFMFERAGRYYFMWSEGGWTGPDYSVAYAVGDSPLGPFKRVAKILQQDPAVATGAGHHSVLRVPNTDAWYIVYHRRPIGETNGNHRVVCIDRMEFDKDGNILPVKMTFEGVASD